jgi:hypothetical protein
MLADAQLVARFMLVRYEDFTTSPAEIVTRIAEFAGILREPLQPFLSHGWRLGNTDQVATRLRNANDELIASLSEEDLAAIRQVAGVMLDRLAYELPEQERAEPLQVP